ncbi:MAG: hypothetical protein HW416_1506 [Chloroflexi bacterium]|nr:hypothetical protein [Chloroflexota bacterium]
MINVTDRAATELKRAIDEQGDAEIAIRVFVQGACGCGKAHYGMGLDKALGEGEQIFETCGVKVVVDEESAPYLEGAIIDYRDSLMNKGFTIENPNRASGGGGCGCGH